MRRLGGGWMIASALACSAPNARFDGDTSSGAATSDTTSETGVRIDLPGAVECADEVYDPFQITLLNFEDRVVPPICGDLDAGIGVQATLARIDDQRLRVTVCSNPCAEPCTDETWYTLDFGEPGAIPQLASTCKFVRVWTALDRDGGCQWDGFSLASEAGDPPEVIASNQIESEALPPAFVGALDATDAVPCGEADCSLLTPGRYAISAGGMPVWPEDENARVVVGDLEYRFDNRSSFVTEDCAKNFSWWAARP